LEITSVVGSSSSGDTSVTISGTNGELAAGDKIQVSSDNGATWTAVVQNTKTSWSLVDNVTHTADFSYQVRIVDTVGNSKIVSQPVRVAYNGGTVSAGASAGLIAEFTGTGGILALGPSDITGTVNAISVAHGAVAINGSGSLIASTGDGIHLTATGGTQANPADLSVNLTGPTFATGGTAISVVQNAAGAITIATSGDVLGLAGRGIFAEQSATGTGSILVTGSGTVSGAVASLGDIKDDTGIFAANLNAANANDVTVSHSGAIFGGIDGIRALTNGNGNVTVSTGPATVYGTTRNAIEATSNGRGNIVVTTAVGGILFSGSSGISANNQATSIPQVGGITASSISVTANGTINSGTTLTGSGSRPAGVLAGYKGGTTNTPNAAVFGNVIIDNFADINAAGGDGIRGYNYGSGDVTINDHAGVIVAKDMYGIAGVSYGIGKVSITTAAGTTVNSGSHGISAVNLATAIAAAAGSTVTVEAHGTIHSGVHLSAGGSQPQGISAGYFPGNVGVSNTSVNGTVFVDNFADIIADAGWGIDAYNFGNGNVTVVDEAGTYVSGGQFGIGAYSSSSGSGSSGNVTINVGAGATISASTLYGQSGIAANVSHGGSISITTSNGDIVNSGGTGIQASITASSALASSQISITAAGTINSGFNITPSGNQPGGMWIGYSPGAGTTVTPNVHGNVVVDSAATINATSGVGIGLYNWGVGNVTATLGSDSDVSGVTAGLNSFANGGGDVTITNDGTVAATSGYGIFAGTGTALATTGNGTISITNSGAIASLGLGNSTVVQINNWSTKDATFTNSATGSVTANLFSASNLNQALGSYSGTNSTNIGRITVNNSGTISGNASFSASFSISGATFNNNAGGLWKINGSNWFGGTSNAINNAGTIRTSGAAYLSASGSLALTNTGTIDVLANSAAFIYANLSGNGTVTIGDRSALELGGSVAATQTISFAGKGLLMLDNPSTASNFTIAGLSVGDTIDLLGGIVIANAGITGSTLNIATNSQTFSYQVTGVQANTAFNVLSVDKIVLVSTTNTITITGQSTPYFDNPSLEKSYIFANDAISGSGVGINIASTDSISAHTISAYINQTSSVSVSGSAVNMTTSGANIALVNAANLNSSGAAGIFTNSTTGSNDVVDYGNVSGQTVGISSRVSGSNPLNIVVGGAATVSGTGTSANGIFALSTSSGAIGITTMPGATINSGATGILAQNQGTSVPSSSISISTSGTINAGSTGISASYLTGSSAPSTIPNPPNTTVHGDIEINNSAAITAGTGVGIAVTNYGVGDISVSNNATITATAAGATTPGVTQTQYGISAFNYGSGNTTVTTGFGSVIQSGGTGLNVGNQATVVAAAAASTVTVVAQGSIHSGANTNNSGSAPSGIQAGFNPGNAGVFNSNVFGDVLVNNNANIIADAGDGINAYNFGTGNIAVNVGFNVSIQALTSATSASGKAPYGIGVSNYGAGDIVVAMSGGDVITSGSSGINAVNLATSIDAAAGALVAVSTAGTIHSGTILTNGGAQPSGIGAGFLGGTSAASNLNVHGTVIVNNAASVTVDAGIGINAYNYGYGDIIINDASGTTVTGVQHGIEAHAEGIGARGNIAINVYSGATVSATSTTTASYGIFALSNDIGNISVITSPGVTINSGSAGINAVNEAAVIDASENSSIVVTAAGTVNSGSHATGTGNAPAGILAGYLGGSGIPASFPLTDLHGNVIVNSTATINAAAGDGIRAYTYGIGDVIVNDLAGTITALEGASPPNGSGVGIAANNFGSGNIHVSTAAGTIINAGGSGIAAVNKAASNASFAVPATSEVSVLSYGTINSGTIATGSGQPPAGILAAYNPNNSNTVDANVHGNVSVDDYASIFAATGTDGIRGANYGTGTVTIVAEAGALISAGRYGIAALGFEGGNVSVTNYATVTGGTLAVNATTTSTGTAVIDNFGHLIGGVEAYNATFTNEIGGEWSLNGVNTFTGASKLVNLGTIDSTGTSLVSGLSQITNTGTFEVISGSLELASPVSGGGAAMIYAATLQFDGASDAQVVFASPASGTLVLAHAAQFTGTVTGFSDGDIIDIQDIAPANVSVSSSGSLHVNYGTGSFDLLGSYEPMDFVIASDGGTGTKITWNHQAPIIATDQISTVQNADGTTTVLGLHVSDSDATASSETFTINAVTGAAASGTSVVPSTSSGSLTGINNVFANGVVYNPGATPPSADKVALTVTDGYGATDTVNFVFNQAGTGSNIVLQGTSGKDVIFATGGQDVLTGGGGTDQFVFKPTSSGPSVQHTITDFVAGLDKIDVREFTNISASALPTETQQGSDTLITLDGHDTLLLKNVIATTLHANDFIINA
jgi:hypothetical protein